MAVEQNLVRRGYRREPYSRAPVPNRGTSVEECGVVARPVTKFPLPLDTPPMEAASAAKPPVDGELVIKVAGRLAFDALQARLHPAASRIQKLSVETPAKLIVFDMLIGPDGTRVMELPLKERRQALERFARQCGGNVALSP